MNIGATFKAYWFSSSIIAAPVTVGILLFWLCFENLDNVLFYGAALIYFGLMLNTLVLAVSRGFWDVIAFLFSFLGCAMLSIVAIYFIVQIAAAVGFHGGVFLPVAGAPSRAVAVPGAT